MRNGEQLSGKQCINYFIIQFPILSLLPLFYPFQITPNKRKFVSSHSICTTSFHKLFLLNCNEPVSAGHNLQHPEEERQCPSSNWTKQCIFLSLFDQPCFFSMAFTKFAADQVLNLYIMPSAGLVNQRVRYSAMGPDVYLSVEALVMEMNPYT